MVDGGAGLVRFGLGLALVARLLGDGDLLLLAGEFERLFLSDARFLDRAIGLDLLRVDLALGLDPRGIGFALPGTTL